MKTQCLVVSILLMCTVLFSQEISYNQEFQVNTYTDNDQEFPVIASLTGGGFVICWESYGQDGSDFGVYAQRYHANGRKAGEEFRVNTFTQYSQAGPVITSLINGGFVICWISYYNVGNDFGIYAQMYDSHGDKVGDEFRVNTYSENKRCNYAITSLTGGGFVICWENDGQDGSGLGIFAQRYHADGSRAGEEFRVNTYTVDDQRKPNITSLGNNGFIIYWWSAEQDGSKWGVYAQRYYVDGSKAGEEFRANTYTSNIQGEPDIVSLTNGDFVICWQSDGQDGDGGGIYAQRYHADGSRAGAGFQVNSYTTSNQWDPVIAPLLNGGFVICWISYEQDGSGFGLYAQLYHADGSKNGGEFQVNTYTDNSQTVPVIASLADGGFAIFWQSNEQDGSDLGVYSQFFDSDGSRIGREFQVNTYTEANQALPIVTSLAGNELVICWQSDGQDGSGKGVYAKYYLSEPIVHQLNLYQLLSPVNDNTQHTKCPNFTWQQPGDVRICYTWEIEYDLYLSTNEDFGDPIIFTGIYDTIFTIPKEDSLEAGQTYFWKVLAKNIAGDSLWSSNTNAFFVSHTASEVEEDTQLPTGYVLEQNYPNPFNPVTSVRYTLPQSGNVELALYDITGRRVMELVNGVQSEGAHTVKIDGSDLASGVYVYTIKAGAFSESKKMVLVR